MTGLDELATAWKEHLERDQKPTNTIKARMRTLRAVGNPGTITREEVEDWWFARADQVKPATRANDLANLRSFYKWCQIWGHRDDDPTVRLEQPKVANGTARPIARDDFTRVLDHLTDHDLPDLRRAVLLGAWGGLRVSEAAGLGWFDIDVEARVIRVIESKGAKSRAIKVSMILVDQLLPNTGRNVVTGTDEVYTPDRLQRRVNRAIKAAGADATFHQLRHRYGTVGYAATGDLLALKKQMGHASIVTTAGYAEANDAAADKIAAAVVR